MLTRESVNKLDTLSKLLHKNNLKLESSQLRSLMIKNSKKYMINKLAWACPAIVDDKFLDS